jgi:hypothetical protein
MNCKDINKGEGCCDGKDIVVGSILLRLLILARLQASNDRWNSKVFYEHVTEGVILNIAMDGREKTKSEALAVPEINSPCAENLQKAERSEIEKGEKGKEAG